MIVTMDIISVIQTVFVLQFTSVMEASPTSTIPLAPTLSLLPIGSAVNDWLPHQSVSCIEIPSIIQYFSHSVCKLIRLKRRKFAVNPFINLLHNHTPRQ